MQEGLGQRNSDGHTDPRIIAKEFSDVVDLGTLFMIEDKQGTMESVETRPPLQLQVSMITPLMTLRLSELRRRPGKMFATH